MNLLSCLEKKDGPYFPVHPVLVANVSGRPAGELLVELVVLIAHRCAAYSSPSPSRDVSAAWEEGPQVVVVVVAVEAGAGRVGHASSSSPQFGEGLAGHSAVGDAGDVAAAGRELVGGQGGTEAGSAL